MFKQFISRTSLLVVLSIPAVLAADPEKQTPQPHPSSQKLVNAKITSDEKNLIEQYRLQKMDPLQNKIIDPKKEPTFLPKYRAMLNKDSILGPFICKGTTIGLGFMGLSAYLFFSNNDLPYKNRLALASFGTGVFTIHASQRSNIILKHFATGTVSFVGTTAAAVSLAPAVFTAGAVCAVIYITWKRCGL